MNVCGRCEEVVNVVNVINRNHRSEGYRASVAQIYSTVNNLESSFSIFFLQTDLVITK